ncbi:MAG: N-acetyl-gamma-glutamyl-phosphate reductase [Lewinellaceae bacterium]|nr:N-acetyl-gamma-glutamyl-phosphate reductase [Lewinellaceae bacterium]
MIKAGIIGGAGYTAGELIRILLWHPEVELAFVQSRSQAGKPVSSIHQDLLGDCLLAFTAEPSFDVDVLFFCMGHGESVKFLETHTLPEKLIAIDLSHDFRWAEGYTYGLPELQREAISTSTRIANPGCFATAIQLGLLPLAKAKALHDEVHIHAVTGSTGAGQSLQDTSHFSWRTNNLSIYKPFRHQHLAEISKSLQHLQPGFAHALNFIPLRGNFTRGIFASLYTNTHLSIEELRQRYQEYYQGHPFVHISPDNPNLKQVANTNKAILYLEKYGDKVLIISLIDNLLKGASGQAVQNMNLALGLSETAGLRLKAMAF